jgi:hypothetical protein
VVLRNRSLVQFGLVFFSIASADTALCIEYISPSASSLRATARRLGRVIRWQAFGTHVPSEYGNFTLTSFSLSNLYAPNILHMHFSFLFLFCTWISRRKRHEFTICAVYVNDFLGHISPGLAMTQIVVETSQIFPRYSRFAWGIHFRATSSYFQRPHSITWKYTVL